MKLGRVHLTFELPAWRRWAFNKCGLGCWIIELGPLMIEWLTADCSKGYDEASGASGGDTDLW